MSLNVNGSLCVPFSFVVLKYVSVLYSMRTKIRRVVRPTLYLNTFINWTIQRLVSSSVGCNILCQNHRLFDFSIILLNYISYCNYIAYCTFDHIYNNFDIMLVILSYLVMKLRSSHCCTIYPNIWFSGWGLVPINLGSWSSTVQYLQQILYSRIPSSQFVTNGQAILSLITTNMQVYIQESGKR